MHSLKPVIALLTPKPAGFVGMWFREVAGASRYAQIKPQNLPLPAAWVVRSADKSKTMGERLDMVSPVIDVVIAIENVREHEPGETDELLLAYRRAVYQQLRGWLITPDSEPVEWLGGRMIDYTDGDLYWADSYSFGALFDNYLPAPTAAFNDLTNTGGTVL